MQDTKRLYFSCLLRNQGEFPAEDHDIVSSLGLILGWLMTCIYLTGRLPQIILNWSRDFVIGVSMSTVIFAFLGNATYLGSLLVRGVEWQRLKFVLPWVVDIAFCLFMDFFVSFSLIFGSWFVRCEDSESTLRLTRHAHSVDHLTFALRGLLYFLPYVCLGWNASNSQPFRLFTSPASVMSSNLDFTGAFCM